MKKLLTKSVSVFLAMLLVMTSLTFNVFALDTDDEKAIAAQYDALEHMEDITISYKVEGFKLQSQKGNFFSTRMNIGNIIIHKVPLPKIPVGKQLDKFIFRSGVGSNTTSLLRIDYTDWDFSDLPKQYSAESPEFAPIVNKKTHEDYSIAEGDDIRVSGGIGSYQKMYREITSYAKECIANGQDYFYMAVGCLASTHSVAQGCMSDSSYTKLGLDPKVLYSFKDAPVLELVSSSVENGAEDVAADEEISFEFSNEIAKAGITVNGDAANVTLDGTRVILADSLGECEDFDIFVDAKDIYGQAIGAELKVSTGLKSGASVPENPRFGSYNVKCTLDENASVDLSFVLLTEFEDVNNALAIVDEQGNEIDAEFKLDSESGRYFLESCEALKENTGYAVIIKNGVSDIRGAVLENDILITRFFTGKTPEDKFDANGESDIVLSIDKEERKAEIFFRTPIYSNRSIEAKLLYGGKELASKTFETGVSGSLLFGGISIEGSGEYTALVSPSNAPVSYRVSANYYTDEDEQDFWELMTCDGSPEELYENWEILCDIFDLDNPYLSLAEDVSELCRRIISTRGRAYIGTTPDEKLEAFKKQFDEQTYFEVFENCTDPNAIRGYVDDKAEELASTDSDVFKRWTDLYDTKFADAICIELAAADKSIEGYSGIISLMKNIVYKYSPESQKAIEIEALGTVVDIPDSYILSGGKLADDSGNFGSTKIDDGRMVIQKIKLPQMPEGKYIDKFYIRVGTGSGGKGLLALKIDLSDWDMKYMPIAVPNTDPDIAPLISADTYKSYLAYEGEILSVPSAGSYTNSYLDVTSYAKECVANGKEYMYLAMGCYASTMTVGVGSMADSDYLRAGYDPKYICSFGDATPNAFVSATVDHNSEDVAADKKITFTFANRIDSATALLNGKNAEVTMQGRDVILKTPLAECSDYTLSIAATDMFGQRVTKTISFSTGFKDGKTEAEIPVIGVYDIGYNIDTVSNELLELSFSLLTKFADVNEAIEIREAGSGRVESEFVFYDTYGKYDLAAPVALTAGKSYEAVIKKGISDIYGNKAAEDVVIAKFFAGSTPDIAVSGDGEEIDVSFDAENASLSVYFKNSLYSNNEVTVTIESDDGDVYTETVTTGKRGVVALYGIALPESGSYTLKIAPGFAPGVYEENISFYSESDISKYWKMVAVSGKATDITSNWAKIEYMFGLSNEYSESISDISALASKIVAQRGKGFGEMTNEAIESLRNLIIRLSYFTAFEQSKTPDEAIALIASEQGSLSGTNKAICNEWNLALASEYAEDLKAALAGAEKTADSYEDIITVMDKALDSYRVKNLLKLIGEAVQRTEVSAIVSDAKNAELLGIADLLERYNALDSTLDVDKALMKKFDSASDFAAAFEEALAQAEDNEDDDDEGGRGGSSSGSSKGSGGSSFHVASTAQSSQTPFNPFADIENISWAKDHITKLYNRGIINGKSSTSFAPYDNITREEFTKLISSMMKLSDNGTSGEFTDVDYSSWYAPFVRAAVSNGVCQGIGGGAFGVGMNATRQDIAVMIVNALKTKGIQITEETAAFADNGEIAGYAMSAVAFLNSKGVLSGDNAKCFNPKSNATRAEVAVMLSRAADIFSIK